MTALPERILSGEVEAPDVFCGGTPCQAFSVAGLRKSLDDERGNLSLTFCEIADAIDSVRYVRNEQPTIIFWENVPGVLNTADNAFGCFLAKLAGESCELQPPGGRWSDSGCVHGPKRTIAWRILDAQYFGLAQRRKRVFVVASSRKGFNPSEILFEFNGERRDTAPSREARKGIAADAQSGFELHETVGTLCADTHPGSYSGQDAYTGRLIPTICFEPRSPDGHARVVGDIAPCLNTMGGGQREPCVTYGMQSTVIGRSETSGPQGMGFCEEVSYTLTKADQHDVVQQYAVRRLTPIECERLQGFPDNYTNIPWRNKPEAPDGPRYKALGNSWAVPVVWWIGERINNQQGNTNE
jgi:DNA (cytosine-5)-methyltransferase 1